MDITLIISGGILIGCIIGLSWFAGSDAPYIPTKTDRIKKVLKLAGVKRGKKFYELGSGDGRVVIEAARLGADSVGIEQSWLRVLYSRYKQSLSLRDKAASHSSSGNVNFHHNNIFNRNYPDADVIYIYLLSKAVNRLEKKLPKELKRGSVVITQTYHFTTWKPFKKLGDFWFYRS